MGRLTLWMGLALPATSWVGDFLVRYMVTRWASRHGVRWPMVASSLVWMAMLILGAILCGRALAQARKRARPAANGGPGAETDATLAAWGLAFAAYFFLLILAQAYPVLVLDPTEIT